MTRTAVDLTRYWDTELESLRDFRESGGGVRYCDWQPTKWQSCSRLVDDVLASCAARGGAPRTAIELGCGSATISVLLAARGLGVTSLDRVPQALELARASCAGLALPQVPRFVLGDFLAEPPAIAGRADIVLSGGVIEHWDRDGQRIVLQRHIELSRRWVLLTVPNLDSPVFQSFLRWAKAAGRFYKDEHHEISVPALAEEAGCDVVLADGCRLFLKRAEHYAAADSELDDFCDELRARLVAAGGDRYAAFPEMSFDARDIDVLYAVEATTAERMRFGFLHYYLLDSQASPRGT